MTATTDGSTGALPPRAAAASETLKTTPVAAGSLDVPDAAQRAIQRATDFLLATQDAQGWWKGDLETNVTMDAEDLLLRQFLGILDEKTTHAAGLFIRGEQHEDGTWATFYGGPGELSTTIEAYVALRLAGDSPDAPHMAKASAWIRAQGGIAAARVFTRIWLALFGWWKWDDLPELPPELIYFPKWMPLNIYDFGCWARQTIVPLTIVSAKRPVRPAPFPLDELHTDPRNPSPVKPLAPAASWDGIFQRLDKALHVYRKVASRRLRKAAMNSAARWIIERQENDGCWGGIQPPAVYSVIALHLLGYDLEHPVMREGLASLDRFAVWREDGARMIEACQSPVWDTCLATIALADAGLPADHPQLVKAADWMLGEEIVRPGDWSVRRPQLPPGGWAFEFHNDNYPDIDDTAEVVLALRRVKHHDPERVEKAIGRGVRWNLGMQSKNGAWGAFDVDNTSSFPNRLPFCDFGEVIDPPSADVTAHVVEMLAVEGLSHDPAPGGASSGCSPNRRRTAPGSAAGASTTYTAQGRWCPRWSPPDCPVRIRRSAVPSTGWNWCRTRTAAGARTCAPTVTSPSGAAGAPPPPRRLPGPCSRCSRRGSGSPRPWSAGSPGSPRPSGRTAPGMSRTSPAPGSRGTSRSTTTSTGRSSR